MGIQLNGMYVHPLCTPSRSALMTGKYASSLGMQNVIGSNQPYGLNLNEKTMPEYMRDAGYKTHLIGKWHLGFFERRYTPTYRGFDSYFGYYNGVLDYYNHSSTQFGTKLNGYDMRDNLDISYVTKGQYATDLFTHKAIEKIENHDTSDPMFMLMTHLAPHAGNGYDPYQAPDDVINRFNYIADKDRRTYAAMVAKLDESVGLVVQALERNDMLENSIILFMSDNGAPTVGKNYSLNK